MQIQFAKHAEIWVLSICKTVCSEHNVMELGWTAWSYRPHCFGSRERSVGKGSGRDALSTKLASHMLHPPPLAHQSDRSSNCGLTFVALEECLRFGVLSECPCQHLRDRKSVAVLCIRRAETLWGFVGTGGSPTSICIADWCNQGTLPHYG